jgi:hypothetical protein
MKYVASRLTCLLTLACCLAWPVVAVSGPKIQITDDSYLQAGVLGQIQATHTEGAADEDDIYLRRARIILSGQMMDGVQFFMDTDSPNAGKAGAGDAEVDIQDAFVDCRLPAITNHWVKAGLILLPFSFESRSGAATLLGNDYNSEAIKLVNTFVWRDYGAEVHGDFLNRRVSYAAGVFDGYDTEGSTKNPDADFRYTAHVAVNVVGEAENSWFYNQNRLGKKMTYVSIGAGVDRQDKASLIKPKPAAAGSADPEASDKVVDSEAYVVDLQSGYEVDDWGLVLNAAWYTWDNSVFEGETSFAEGGVWVGKTMVTTKYSVQEPDKGSATEDFTVGVHEFLKGHAVRAGLEYRWGDSPDQWLLGLQFLL